MKSKLFSAIHIVVLIFAASLSGAAQNGINSEPPSVKSNAARATIPPESIERLVVWCARGFAVVLDLDLDTVLVSEALWHGREGVRVIPQGQQLILAYLGELRAGIIVEVPFLERAVAGAFGSYQLIVDGHLELCEMEGREDDDRRPSRKRRVVGQGLSGARTAFVHRSDEARAFLDALGRSCCPGHIRFHRRRLRVNAILGSARE